MDDKIFLNFPIQLLQDAFIDIRRTLQNVMDYAGYAHTLKLDLGTKEKKMTEAGKYFGITWSNKSFQNGEMLYSSIPKNSPLTGISKDVCFDFYNSTKSHDQIAVLTAFLALKSILGSKPYCKTTNEFLLARMGGYASVKDVPQPLPEPLVQYSSRRKLDKIKKELQFYWNLNYYSFHTRGFYISIDNRMDLNQLVFQALKKRKSFLEKQLQQSKEEARQQALTKLQNNS